MVCRHRMNVVQSGIWIRLLESTLHKLRGRIHTSYTRFIFREHEIGGDSGIAGKASGIGQK